MPAAAVRGVCFFGGFAEDYPRSSVLRKGLEKRGVTVAVCRARPKRRLVARYAALSFKYARMKRDFEVIFVPEFRHKDVPLAYVLGRMSGKRVVFDPLVSRYDTKIKDREDARDGSLQARHNRNIDRLSFASCDLLLADTAAHARYYEREMGARRDRIRVLPVGFDEDLFAPREPRPAAPQSGRSFTAFFYGSYLPLHGVDVIAAAAKELEGEDVGFALVGGGQTFAAVEEYVRRNGLSNVRFLPRLSLEEIARRLREVQVSLGVFGRSEKTGRVVPNKVYQSMASGVPVITSDTEAVRELFTDGENIFLVPPADAAALAAKLRELKDRPDLARRVGEAGSRFVHGRFTSGHIADRFLAFCESIGT